MITRKFSNKIIVKLPSIGIGESVLATPVLPALRKDHPTAQIDVATFFPEIFYNNPYVSNIFDNPNDPKFDLTASDYDRIINLNLDPDWARTTTHVFEYEKRAATTILDPTPNLYITEHEIYFAQSILADKRLYKKPLVSIGLLMNRISWHGRNWVPDFAKRLLNLLSKEFNNEIQFVEVGAAVPFTGAANSINMIGQTTIRQMFAIVQLSDFFIGVDSLPLHAAQAARKPGVVLFGATAPETRILISGLKSLRREDLDCIGCYKTNFMPESCHCPKRGEVCMKELYPEQVFDFVKPYLEEIVGAKISNSSNI